MTYPGDLWALMRAQQLENERLRKHLDQHHHPDLCESSAEDPDSMEDDDKPYFWNRRP